jgi:hypothetical protein
MELLFLVIFLFFIVLNVIIGLATSRAKRRRAALKERPTGEPLQKGTEIDDEEVASQPAAALSYDSFLQPQTADSVPQPVYVKSGEIQAHLPGVKRTALGEVSGEVSREEPEEGTALKEKAPEGSHMSRRMQAARRRVEQTSMATEAEEKTSTLKQELDYRQAAQQFPEIRWEDTSVRPAARLWEYVESLPPLQRAIILSEILGSPKALDVGSHTQPSWSS